MSAMKITRFLLITALVPLFLAACFGGGSGEMVPAHLSVGGIQTVRGLTWYEKGCYTKALEHFFRAFELFCASDQERQVAMSLNNIGTVYRVNGDLESADAFFAEAAHIYKSLEDKEGLRQALVNQAAVSISQEKFARAEKLLDQAAGLVVKEGEPPFLPVMNNRAVLAIKTGDYAKARQILALALALAPESITGRATLHYTMGSLLLGQKHYKEAAGYFEKALDADREMGFYMGMANDLNGMAQAFSGAGMPAEAVRSWKRAARIYALLGADQKTRAVTGKMQEAAEKIQENTAVTEMFVDRGLRGKQ